MAVLVVLQLAALGGLYLVLRHIRAAEDRQKEFVALTTIRTFRQLESLHALYVDLDLRHSLRRTRDWAASPDFLQTLAEEILGGQRRKIIEFGSGVSTIVIGRALQRVGGGHLWSLEHDPEYAAESRANAARHGIGDHVTVIDAPLTPLSLPGWEGRWYRREALPRTDGLDLMVVDGPPFTASERARYPAVPMLFDQLRAGAMILLDDADRPQEREIVSRWCDEHPGLVRRQAPECEKGLAILVKS